MCMITAGRQREFLEPGGWDARRVRSWRPAGGRTAPHEDLSGPCIFYYEVDFLDLGGNLLAAYQSFRHQQPDLRGAETVFRWTPGCRCR